MEESIQKVLEMLRRKLSEEVGSEVLEVLVYGSQARGTAHSESDVDLLVVTKEENKDVAKKIRSLIYDVELESGVVLSVQVYSQPQVEYLRQISSQYIQQVEQEAIKL